MMSSTSSTSSSAMLADRSLMIRTRPDDSVAVPPYELTSMRSIRSGIWISRIRSAMNGSEPLSTDTSADRGDLAAERGRAAIPRAELGDLVAGSSVLASRRISPTAGVRSGGVRVTGRRSSRAGRGAGRRTSGGRWPRGAAVTEPRIAADRLVGGERVAAVSGRSTVGHEPRDATRTPGRVRAASAWPVGPGQVVEQRQPAELEQQGPEVARVEQLDPDVGVGLAEPAQLAVLLADELLLERRELDVQVDVRAGRSPGRSSRRPRRRSSTSRSGRCRARRSSGPRRSRGPAASSASLAWAKAGRAPGSALTGGPVHEGHGPSV